MAYVLNPIYEAYEKNPVELEQSIKDLLLSEIDFLEYSIPPTHEKNEQDGTSAAIPMNSLPKRQPRIYIGGMPGIKLEELAPAVSIRRYQEDWLEEKNLIKFKIMPFIYHRDVEEGYSQLMELSQKIMDTMIKKGKYEVLRPVYQRLEDVTEHDENGAPIVAIDRMELKPVYSLDKSSLGYVRRTVDAEQKYPYVVGELYFAVNGENADREDGNEFLSGDDFLMDPTRSAGIIRDEDGEIIIPDYEP